MGETDLFWKDQTVTQVRDFLNEKIEKGTVCPCCQQTVKIYTRPLTSSMAYALILLYKAPEAYVGEFIHVEDHFKKLDIPSSIRGDFPKLRFWGLVEVQAYGKEEGNPNNGLYRITDNGKAFVRDRLAVPSSVRIYKNRFLGFGTDNKLIDIKQALKNKFDYNELMK